MSLQIVHYGDPVLRRKGEPIKNFDDSFARFAREMIDTMHAAGGIGLAAQQVGRALQLCVVDLRSVETDFTWELDGAKPPLELFMPMIIANPELTLPPDSTKSNREEGCLSFPDIRGDIVRPDETFVKFQDENGVPHTLRCDGLLARCIQHEIDHLNGVLFIDRMAKKVRAALGDEVNALAKSTRDAAKAGRV
ncbi:MAG TPA: peptide deformylase [Opitutus sp.]|nr:peptide deformylase [Opitutus sp.]